MLTDCLGSLQHIFCNCLECGPLILWVSGGNLQSRSVLPYSPASHAPLHAAFELAHRSPHFCCLWLFHHKYNYTNVVVICSYVEYRQRWYSSTMMFLPVYFNAGVAYGLGVGPAWYCVIVFYLGGLACCRHIPCSNDEWERKTIFNKVQ